MVTMSHEPPRKDPYVYVAFWAPPKPETQHSQVVADFGLFRVRPRGSI